jgi:O-phosphoseryl-tRNA(Cys) synthetase
MTRRRRRQDARWSASFSLTIVNGSVRTPIAVDVCDADLESLLKGLVGRAQFRFRFNGKSRAYSVPLVNGANEAVAFRNLLRVAITEDWDLVGSRPTPPQPVASGHAAEFSLPHARSERSRLWPGRH